MGSVWPAGFKSPVGYDFITIFNASPGDPPTPERATTEARPGI